MPKNPIEYWLDAAEHDLDVAEALFVSEKYDYCLFLGHLVIEKVLKALYIQNLKEPPPKTHNLLRLAENANIGLTSEQKQLLGEISRFNIDVRYPDYKGTFYEICTKKFADDYLSKIKDLKECLISQIKQSKA